MGVAHCFCKLLGFFSSMFDLALSRRSVRIILKTLQAVGMKALKLGFTSSYDLLHICNKMFQYQEVVLKDVSEMSVTIRNNLILLLSFCFRRMC